MTYYLEAELHKIVCRIWGGNFPPKCVCERVEKEITPLLKHAKNDDPYVAERIACICNDHRLHLAMSEIQESSAAFLTRTTNVGIWGACVGGVLALCIAAGGFWAGYYVGGSSRPDNRYEAFIRECLAQGRQMGINEERKLYCVPKE